MQLDVKFNSERGAYRTRGEYHRDLAKEAWQIRARGVARLIVSQPAAPRRTPPRIPPTDEEAWFMPAAVCIRDKPPEAISKVPQNIRNTTLFHDNRVAIRGANDYENGNILKRSRRQTEKNRGDQSSLGRRITENSYFSVIERQRREWELDFSTRRGIPYPSSFPNEFNGEQQELADNCIYRDSGAGVERSGAVEVVNHRDGIASPRERFHLGSDRFEGA